MFKKACTQALPVCYGTKAVLHRTETYINVNEFGKTASAAAIRCEPGRFVFNITLTVNIW